MGFPILSDDELDRIYAAYPEMVEGSCPTCHDQGSYRWEGERHDCDCTTQKQLFVHYARAGIGLRYQQLTWDDLRLSDEQLAPLYEWLDHADAYIDAGLGLFLVGPHGTGKTLAALLILKDLVKRGYDCYATTFAEMVENLIETWRSPEDKRRFHERFTRSRVLVLDDLGKEFRNAFRNQLNPTTFDYILRTRVQNKRPLIVTTNLTNVLSAGYGESVLSLLTEACVDVSLSVPDFRPQAKVRSRDEVKAGERRPLV